MVVKMAAIFHNICCFSVHKPVKLFSHFKKERKKEIKGQHYTDTEVESERETQVQMAENREVRLKGADKGRTGSGPEEMETAIPVIPWREKAGKVDKR